MSGREIQEQSSPGGGESGIELLRRRTGLQVSQTQVDALDKDLANIDAIARRIREGLQHMDEPAFVFKVPR